MLAQPAAPWYYTLKPGEAVKLGAELKSIVGNRRVWVFATPNAGPLPEQIADALREAGVQVEFEDMFFANAGLWVSPQDNVVAEHIANMLANATGRNVSLDTLDIAQAAGRPAGATDISIVVSKIPYAERKR